MEPLECLLDGLRTRSRSKYAMGFCDLVGRQPIGFVDLQLSPLFCNLYN